ncbi:Uncharacterised protein [Candidatus Venteria ishoeyi]|uniref:Uncharacterized protein n=1 Tax=Candidatus Venteria ishoeyi TaxID=1899563 RepID=A0A1H6F579_9GAMM|nr:Uncharacterised protein [Candidatus Venteria ishoeyi]
MMNDPFGIGSEKFIDTLHQSFAKGDGVLGQLRKRFV